jgi:hypothetical protein
VSAFRGSEAKNVGPRWRKLSPDVRYWMRKGASMTPEFFDWSMKYLGCFVFVTACASAITAFAALTCMLHLNDIRKHFEKEKNAT